MARNASAPPAIGKVGSFFFAGFAAAIVGAGGGADRSTTGLTWLVRVAGTGAAAAGGADLTVRVATVWLVTLVAGAGAGLAVATCVVRWAVRVVVVVLAASAAAGATVLLSVAEVVGSSGTVVDVEVEGALVAGSVVTGCAWGTSWASSGVEESARAAAIAGRALVRA